MHSPFDGASNQSHDPICQPGLGSFRRDSPLQSSGGGIHSLPGRESENGQRPEKAESDLSDSLSQSVPRSPGFCVDSLDPPVDSDGERAAMPSSPDEPVAWLPDGRKK